MANGYRPTIDIHLFHIWTKLFLPRQYHRCKCLIDLIEIDLVSGVQAPVHVSTGSFTIGISAWDPDSGILYVPDAAENAVIELAWDGDGFTAVGSKEIAPGLGLPPTQVYLLN